MARLRLRGRAGLLACTLALAWAGPVLAQASAPSPRDLRIDFMVSSGAQRTAWVALIERFQKLHPELHVLSREFEQEAYKRDFERRMAAGQTDLAFWFAGERLRQAVASGMLEPLKSVALLRSMQNRLAPAVLEATQFGSQRYAMPLKYYQWGFYYRKSLFARLALRPPETWDEFLVLCERLRAEGVTPTAVGARDGWPAAAWFDYLNLRLNGLETHRRLMRGDIGWDDPSVARVLASWAELLRKGYFLPQTSRQDWASVLPYLYRSEVGMLLLGAFATVKFPAELRQDIGFFPFPRSDQGRAEDAPLDVLVIPAGAQGRADAERFLHFLTVDPALNSFNEALGELSPRLDAPPSSHVWLAQGKQLLDSTPAITFFFDRDARKELIGPAFRTFEQLLTPPHRLPELDAAPQRPRLP